MTEHDSVSLDAAKLILAEKRTALATLRTAIAVSALPLSLISFLIAFSSHYDLAEVGIYLGPVLGVCALLLGLAAFLAVRGVREVLHCSRVLAELKRQHPTLGQLLD